MPGPVYSSRFMVGRGGNRIETYTVPEGRRAVVRHVGFMLWSTQTWAILKIHGIPLWYTGIQVSADAALFAEVRFTAYAGETIVIQISGADASYAVDGFLFVDHDGRPDDADNVIQPSGGTKPAAA